jgi:acid phosphatase
MRVNRRDFVRTLFAASLAGGLSRLRAGTNVSPTDTLNFAIIGDWGRHGRPDQTAVAQQMALACDQAKARFVISVGDNFYEDGAASVDDPHWQRSFEQVYAAPSLQVPWYVILGNHDYRGSVEAQLAYAKTHPRWGMPARHFQQSHMLPGGATADFFYIDTSPMIAEYMHEPHMPEVTKQDVPAQLAWLDGALAASKAPWKLVFGHHPIYSAGIGHGSQEDMIRLVLPLLQKHGVQAYIAGHDHDLQHLRTGNLHLIISGGGSEHRLVGELPETIFGLPVSGFALASLGKDDLQVRYIDDKGALLHTAQVPRVSG